MKTKQQLLKEFEKLTGCPVIINTSFNIRGEPIVGTPQDAYRCFMCTNMDYLVIGNFIFDKEKQPNKDKYKKEYHLNLKNSHTFVNSAKWEQEKGII